MTCIAGIVTDEGVVMCSDSAASDGVIIIQNEIPKIFEKGDGPHKAIFGVAGSVRLAEVIGRKLSMPPRVTLFEETGVDQTDEYVMERLVPRIFDLCLESGIGSMSDLSNEVLIGIDKRLYYLDIYGGLARSANKYEAIGSGKSIALGSLFTSRDLDLCDVGEAEMVRRAVRAAAHLTVYVRLPVHTLELKNGETKWITDQW